jgi:transcriptional regulator with XRE-family HTH domain
MRSQNGNYLLIEDVQITVKQETEVTLLEYIGKKIRKARTAKNFTQTQLSFMTGDLVSNATISQIETATTNPSVNILDAIAQALDLEITDLFPPKYDTEN